VEVGLTGGLYAKEIDRQTPTGHKWVRPLGQKHDFGEFVEKKKGA